MPGHGLLELLKAGDGVLEPFLKDGLSPCVNEIKLVERNALVYNGKVNGLCGLTEMSDGGSAPRRPSLLSPG